MKLHCKNNNLSGNKQIKSGRMQLNWINVIFEVSVLLQSVQPFKVGNLKTITLEFKYHTEALMMWLVSCDHLAGRMTDDEIMKSSSAELLVVANHYLPSSWQTTVILVININQVVFKNKKFIYLYSQILTGSLNHWQNFDSYQHHYCDTDCPYVVFYKVYFKY